MENKPIKRNTSIVKLSREHHLSLLFCWKIREGLKKEVPAQRINSYVAYFTRRFLIPHFIEEESYLFSKFQDRMVTEAAIQHREIRMLLQEMEADGYLPHEEDIKKLAHLLDHHIRYEERELFPYMEKLLTYEQMEEIGEKLGPENLADQSDDFKDTFWVNSRANHGSL